MRHEVCGGQDWGETKGVRLGRGEEVGKAQPQNLPGLPERGASSDPRDLHGP